jgi:hypothetical protein
VSLPPSGPRPTPPGHVPRLRLSLAAWAVVREALDGADAADAVVELAAKGALVRRQDGALVVDPALAVVLKAWRAAPVRLEVVVDDGTVQVHAEAGVDASLAVCVVRGRRDGHGLDAVDVTVPSVAGVVDTVLGEVPAGGDAVRSLWIRLRGPHLVLVDHVTDTRDGWCRPLVDVRRSVHFALTAALDEVAIAGGGSSWR